MYFDLDGTLANTLYSIANFSNRALRACGYPTIDPEDFRKIVGDGADTQMRRMLTRVKGAFTEEELSHLRTIYDGYYAADPTDRIQPYDGMMDTLQQLHAKGIRLAVLSNKPHAGTVSTFKQCLGTAVRLLLWTRAGIPKSRRGTAHCARGRARRPCQGVPLHRRYQHRYEDRCGGRMDTAGALWGFRDRRELEENHAVYILEKPTELLGIVLGDK